jgi:hypothetical protein
MRLYILDVLQLSPASRPLYVLLPPEHSPIWLLQSFLVIL